MMGPATAQHTSAHNEASTSVFILTNAHATNTRADAPQHPAGPPALQMGDAAGGGAASGPTGSSVAAPINAAAGRNGVHAWLRMVLEGVCAKCG